MHTSLGKFRGTNKAVKRLGNRSYVDNYKPQSYLSCTRENSEIRDRIPKTYTWEWKKMKSL